MDAAPATHAERMAAGLWYDANFDPELLEARRRAASACRAFNACDPADAEECDRLMRAVLGSVGAAVEVLAPLTVDYGSNVTLGDGCFVNHGAYFMDGAPVTLGSHVFVGPDCGFYTACHPLVPEERNAGWERALPITVGDDVWIGAKVCLLPGVTVGAGSVAGAGSVVTRDVPPGVVAAGNPCRPVRAVTDADRVLSGGVPRD